MPRIELPKLVDQFGEHDGVDLGRLGGGESMVQRKPLAIPAALQTAAAAAEVHEDLPHGRGRDRQEVVLVVPGQVRMLHQAHERLVDQRGRLERGTKRLIVHPSAGNAPKLVVDHRHEVANLQRRAVVVTAGRCGRN